jgi:nucleoid-associated protein YgaU
MFASSRAIVLASAAAGIASVSVVAWQAVVSPPPSLLSHAPTAAQAPAPPTTPEAPIAKPLIRPSFDVVRVEPTGETVVAGRSAPGARVTLLDGERPLAEVTADAAGQFAMVPPALEPGDHVLTLSAKPGTPGSDAADDLRSLQSVAVDVPARGGKNALVALAEPGQPTRVLSAAAPDGASPLAIRTAEVGEEGAFFASGLAPAGVQVRLYLNDAFVAEVVASPEGRWSLKVQRGLTPGHYDVRADMVEAAGKVAARVRVPFDMPESSPAHVASARGPGNPAAPAGAAAGVALVPEVQSVTVGRGDSLWRISRKVFGAGRRYTQIYEANAAQIGDPNRIWPGQVLVTPQTAVP